MLARIHVVTFYVSVVRSFTRSNQLSGSDHRSVESAQSELRQQRQHRGLLPPREIETLASNIKAVALFASPSFTPGELYNWTGSGSGRGVFGEVTGSLSNYTTLAWIAPAYSEKGFLPKIRSYCLPGDMFCQSNIAGRTVHESYKSNSAVMRDAWLFSFNWLVTYE